MPAINNFGTIFNSWDAVFSWYKWDMALSKSIFKPMNSAHHIFSNHLEHYLSLSGHINRMVNCQSYRLPRGLNNYFNKVAYMLFASSKSKEVSNSPDQLIVSDQAELIETTNGSYGDFRLIYLNETLNVGK